MKFFKYLLSLALVCTCLFSVSYAQSRKVVKPQLKRGIINDTLIFVKKPVRTPNKTTTLRKKANNNVQTAKRKSNTTNKATMRRQKEGIRPRNH